MIYIGKVTPSLMDPPKKVPIMEFFKNYRPLEVSVPDDESGQKKLKLSVLKGFISGEMKALVRKNANLISRDAVVLDLDDVLVSENELLESIMQKFGKFDFILYPSISNGIKGVRYRFVIPLDESVGEVDYKMLIQFMNEKALTGIVGQADESNQTWSQIMLLPVITENDSKEKIVINEGSEPFPLKDMLEAAKKWQIEHQPKRSYENTNAFKRGGSRYRNTTTELFESLVAGCSEGNRNNRIAQITGGLLARAVNVKAAYELVIMANEHFDEPLPMAELNTTFESIAKKELGA